MKTENLYIVYPIINIPTISKIKEQFDGSYWFSPDKQLAFKGVFLKLMNPYIINLNDELLLDKKNIEPIIAIGDMMDL